MDYYHIASHGFNYPDFALAMVRVATGGFFAISGYHKLFNPTRHKSLLGNLTKNHIPCLRITQWWVPMWEFLAGIMLAIGLLSAFSAFVLIIICVVACCCEANIKVQSYNPIDWFDMIDDYLYLPEVLYIILLAVNILAGTGRYSLDWYLFPAIRGIS